MNEKTRQQKIITNDAGNKQSSLAVDQLKNEFQKKITSLEKELSKSKVHYFSFFRK